MGTFLDPLGGVVPAQDVIVHNQGQMDGGGAGGGTENVNLIQVGGSAIGLGQNISDNSFPVTMASDLIMQIGGTLSGTMSLLAGTAIVGKVGIDQTTPGTTNAVQTIPGTTGGLSLSSVINPGNTTAVVVKASAGQVYKVEAFSIGASNPVVIHWYNATSATVGVGTPVWRTVIPAPTAGGGGYVTETPHGLAFSTGITYIVTTGLADNDTGVPTAGLYVVNVGFK